MNPIASIAKSHLSLPTRLQNVATWYLLSLMIRAPKHTLGFAEKISGLHKSQFSRFLKKSKDHAVDSLNQLINWTTNCYLESRDPIIRGVPWTITVIVDATLQKRSSRHVHNAQHFNHGKGFVIGHQWTNIILVINGIKIPLPPIKFLTKKERKRLKLPKVTEHQCVAQYLENLDLHSIVGSHRNKEVVVLMDAGYDNKKIQNVIISRGWDFVAALKCSRNVKTNYEEDNGFLARRVDNIFWACRKNTPWNTVHDFVNSFNGRKRKDFRARELLGYLVGVKPQVKIVLSEERGHRKGRKHLACTNLSVSTGAIVRAYRKRWAVEIFHKEIKSLLGFEDVSSHDFASVEAHVHWVYCAYLFLRVVKPNASSIPESMGAVEKLLDDQPFLEIRKQIERFGGKKAVKEYCSEVIRRDIAA